MIMRRGLVPLLTRYGGAIVAALVVYFIIRHPVNSAVSYLRYGPQAAAAQDEVKGLASSSQNNAVSGANDVPRAEVGPESEPGTKTGPESNSNGRGPAAAAAAKIREKHQTPFQEMKRPKVYKKPPERYAAIDDPFPWLTYNNKAPQVKENNLSPVPHVPEETPLLIGFSRNWPMLLQCVSSYIAAGWPASDIYVVENTPTFHANKKGELGLQNPFFLNHTQLRILGVHVMTTPTLLSFAQLQNFYLDTAMQRNWPYFFWGHQNVIVFSDEEVRKKDRDHDHDHDPYATIYERAVGLMRYLRGPDMPPWATHFFAYDHLTLVNRDAYQDVGGWDTHIPFDASDCDMYLRLHWSGYWQPQSEAGLIFDVNMALDDVGALFRLPGSHASFAGDAAITALYPDRPGAEVEQRREREMKGWVEKEGETWQHLVEVAGRMQDVKEAAASPGQSGVWRNTRQQSGGQDEPFYHDADGFEAALNTMSEAGRRVFADKWGHRGCNLIEMGIDGADAWMLERNWDITESPGSEGGSWGKNWMDVG